MKRAGAFFLALMMGVSLAACSEGAKGPEVFKRECGSAEEVVELLAEHYTGTKEEHEIMRKNESIYKYFRKENAEGEMWKKLRSLTDEEGMPVFSLREVSNLYNACNQLADIDAEEGVAVPLEGLMDFWYEYISIEGEPLIMYGSDALTVKKLVDSIKKKFKDPESVSIENAWICFEFPEGAESAEDFKVYDEDCRYVVRASVRAKNGFGANDMAVCVIEGDVGWTFSVKETSGTSDLLIRPTAMTGYSEWYRLF